MLDRTYRPDRAEAAVFARWREAGAFDSEPESGGEPFCIVMPPPNVTGSLHIGHALNMTLQDVLTRFRRMEGRNALWQPGTDHAGIATQMVVERRLAEAGENRREMGRDAFVERVWKWKAESGGAISRQLQRLGASPDWRRERFTLDEGLSRAVRTAFVRLHRGGLVYRDKRLVNWDCRLLTAVSDLEVAQREVRGSLWRIRYPVEGGGHVTVATTRPETMLGDTAVAVHPEDPRYRRLVGKRAVLPLVGRRIPIVADEHSDPEKGTGAVKITPAHDFDDFEVGRRHGLEAISILDAHGKVAGAAPDAYLGMDRFDARRRVVAELEALGLLEAVEEYAHTVPHGDRSGTVVEPRLTDQWFVDAKALAGPAIAAVEDGRIRFVPKNWENTYFEWMRNIQPWCVSRQLWWGHRIPAWYGPDGEIFVAMDAAEAEALAAAHYGEARPLVQDEDVLDTWFSSALWPVSTLGWPDDTPELRTWHPTSALVTGFDIIFFWVARMIMFGLHFTGAPPFRDVYVHALVRDARGRKMSKSEGNVIDPLETMDAHGADALRLALTAMAAQGRDIKLSEERVVGYRNFVTKLWNAARFCELNGCAAPGGSFPDLPGAPDCGGKPGSRGIAMDRRPVSRWIVTETVDAVRAAGAAIAEYRFNEAAERLYNFVWREFCDRWLELAKPALQGADEEEKAHVRAVTGWVLDQALAALHPIIPFVTEELRGRLGGAEDGLLMTSRWPRYPDEWRDEAARDEVGRTLALAGAVRSARAELNVPPGARPPLVLAAGGPGFSGRRAAIAALARAEVAEETAERAPPGAVEVVAGGASAFLQVADVIDVAAEKARLARERDKLRGAIAQLDRKLANPQFLSRAPADVVAEQRARRAAADDSLRKFDSAAARLEAL